MYLVAANAKFPSPPTKRGRRHRRRQPRKQLYQHNDWIKPRTKNRNVLLLWITHTKEVTDYFKQVLPAASIPP